MVEVPTPAMAGLNVFALTPVPVYVPPAGAPPVRSKGASYKQTAMFSGQVTVMGLNVVGTVLGVTGSMHNCAVVASMGVSSIARPARAT